MMAAYANMDPSYALPSLDEDHVESLQGTPATEASMQQPYSRQQPNIPLVCSICPKNSTFSDISHLLTHVSSKGHLHNYFQLSISRETDEDAAFALAEFDNWFEENDINTLLRLRKSARAERGSQPQRRSQTPAIAQSGRVARRSTRGRRGGRGTRGSRTTTRNTRTRYFPQQDLEQIEIKDESDNVADFGIAYGSASGKALRSWQSDLTFPVDDIDDDEEDSKYEPSELYSPLPSEDTTEIAADGTGALVLKGVVYPGMGGFDAAREDQRRQRNQRKDPAVLRRLKVNSESVTTTEEVLDYSLDYQRTRDVYDDPSIDGTMDEEEDVKEVKRRKRRNTRMDTTAPGKRRRGTTSRQQTRASRGARATRSSTRATQPAATASLQTNVPSTRVTRSSTSRQAQLPLHNHGLHPDLDFYRAVTGLEPDEGWTSVENLAEDLRLTSDSQDTITVPSVEADDDSESNWSDASSAKLTLRRNDRLPGLALRPGNPNLAFASPTLGLKKSPPSLYPGKENNHLSLKSPTSSSNPYLQTPGDSIENNNYNPLYVQPRDGFGFRTYSPYDEEPKPATGGFQAINGHDGLNSLNFSSHHNADYHRNQNGGDVYGI